MNWIDYLGPMMDGAWVTVKLTLYSTILGAIFSFMFGLGKLSRHWYFKVPSVAYIEVFRGTSLLVQMFWLFYALPLVGQLMGVDTRIPPVIAGILALSANIGAYGAEVVRGAIQAVSKKQYEAATALNFTPKQTLWRIALPQAIPEMMPVFGNLAIQNLKDTALVSLITISDLAFVSERLRNLTQESAVVYTLALFMYFGMALVLAGMLKMLSQYVGTWRRAAGGK
ncbi:ectoine/hydroxyectoine ABC transporter, permease protein EhuC [Flexistipes sinusarabici DSM 4947]|uniref:Ectoine/hydroxyectoine ABC transporter, permease protein EhuC n=1 Tax=Flexistipes sinusarabici (strain ATCC 49648 / DSM 4947 / MAS 10) TaxID=717231 RepID=F8E4L1_FLESM|nr:ectoine/hydroxyectoine ABC transporter permease subunit EhuC [Flexistipes sinusarabici]AEI15569.1 ectoine/hydroxyectoine ABC transporter, permease protein EhuC [Flexistipes sinusarabici DSM 4947]